MRSTTTVAVVARMADLGLPVFPKISKRHSATAKFYNPNEIKSNSRPGLSIQN